jgi:hypothetical protein
MLQLQWFLVHAMMSLCRGGSATANIVISIAVNRAPEARMSSYQEVATFRDTHVVIAPLAVVSDPDDGDDAALVLLSFSTPQYGKVELISCCNNKNVKDTRDRQLFFGGLPTVGAGGLEEVWKQVADYRYTPNPGSIQPGTAVSELLQFSVSDGNGGILTTQFNITIREFMFTGQQKEALCSGTVLLVARTTTA